MERIVVSGALTGLLVSGSALAAAAYETEEDSINCSAGDYGKVTANGSGEIFLKPPGASQYYFHSFDTKFRVASGTVFLDGDWGASADLLLESVTYASCV